VANSLAHSSAYLKDVVIETSNLAKIYKEGEIKAVDNLNLKIREGEIYALIGANGSGKTTLVNLIPRFYDATKGRITIDGIDVRDLKIKDLRYLMGIVSQHPILFNTTFMENIAFGVDAPEMEQIENAARIANAHDFIIETEEKSLVIVDFG
jgi:ABC-type multidrug transport system fused ATPase/permease subunit